jgi:hypothetical protein
MHARWLDHPRRHTDVSTAGRLRLSGRDGFAGRENEPLKCREGETHSAWCFRASLPGDYPLQRLCHHGWSQWAGWVWGEAGKDAPDDAGGLRAGFEECAAEDGHAGGVAGGSRYAHVAVDSAFQEAAI